jgi:trigger factor
MKVTLKKIDEVNADVSLEVAKADYAEQVQKSLEDLKRKANIPGFRPGKAPKSMIEKMYGKSVLYDEVNKFVIDKLYDYIRTENLHVLGEPLPAEGQAPIDLDSAEDFTFTFNIGLAPEINLTFDKTDKLTYYKIKVADEMIDRQIDSYKSNFGDYSQSETIAERDLVKGVLTELDENGAAKNEGINIENAVIMPSFIKNEDEKKKIIGAKLDSTIVFNPFTAYEGNETELSSLLKIKKEETGEHKGDFSLTIKEISSYKEAEINQDLFDKIFGKDNVKTEQEFREKIAEIISQQIEPQSDFKFVIDLREMLKAKTGDLKLPETFLKRWLLLNSKTSTPEKIEEDFPKILEDLKFQLINDKIIKDNDIKVEDDDIRAAAKDATRAQLAKYGMATVPDDLLEQYSSEMLKKEETIRNLIDKVLETKLTAVLKEKITVTEKSVSVEEFQKLFEPESKEAKPKKTAKSQKAAEKTEE